MLRDILRFRPLLAGARAEDRVAAALGALAAIAIVAAGSAALLQHVTSLWLVAPIGASAVLIFAVPSSPLAQPWPVIGGNLVSALVGVMVAKLIASPIIAASVAVALAIAVMSQLRCLHPPGGAAALMAVIGGPSVHMLGWSFPFLTVGLNSVALVAAGILFHRLSRHSYPHRTTMLSAPAESEIDNDFDAADIEEVLDELGESFDISTEDLETIIGAVKAHAAARRRRDKVNISSIETARRAA